MAQNFETALKWTLAYEGGFSNDRRDPGNWTGGKVGVGKLLGTKYGIAANSFPNLDIPNITIEQAGAIYRTKYWDNVPCGPLASGVDALAFDIAVNSGPGRVKPWLNATDNLPAPQRVKAISARRASFFQSLRTFSTFGKGWMRRCADLEAKCLALALRNSPAAIPATLLKESDTAKKAVRNNATGAGGVALVGPPTAVQADPTSLPWWASVVIVAAIAIPFAVLVYKVALHQARAKALKEVANG